MAKKQANYPNSLDVLNTDRIAGQDCLSDTDDIMETAITQIEAELRRVTTKTATGTLTASEGGTVLVKSNIVTGTDIAFVDGGAGEDTITSVANAFGGYAVGDSITITGATNAGNNSTFTLTGAVAGTLTVATASLTAEAAGASVTIKNAYTLALLTAVGNNGLTYFIVKTDDNANLITIDGDGTETINGSLTYTDLNYQYAYVAIRSDNVNWYVLFRSTNNIAVTTDKLSVFAATTSAELAGVISDETGTDKLVYNTSPTLVTPVLGAASATSINLTGGQIAFPAAQAASAGANTLDDYGEGTWTMGITFGGNAVDVTYSSNTGYYTKIGNIVTISGFLVLTAKGTSTGNAVITGLPFTVINNSAGRAAAALRFDKITFANQYIGHAGINSTTINLEEITEAGVVTGITNADFADISSIMVNCTYRVA